MATITTQYIDTPNSNSLNPLITSNISKVNNATKKWSHLIKIIKSLFEFCVLKVSYVCCSHAVHSALYLLSENNVSKYILLDTFRRIFHMKGGTKIKLLHFGRKWWCNGPPILLRLHTPISPKNILFQKIIQNVYIIFVTFDFFRCFRNIHNHNP